MKTINDYAELVKEEHALNKTLAPVEDDLTGASQPYAKGAKFINNGILCQTKTDIAQGAALVLNTNYEVAPDVETQIANEAAARSQMGAKNLLPFDLDAIKDLNTAGTWASNVYSYRGVDFTVNSDGTILADGQATGGNASIKVFAATSSYEMLGKNVILNGCPSGGSATTYRIQAYRMGSVDGATGTYFDDGDGTVAFDALNNASGTVGSFAVAVYENYDADNLLFKPMVRLATDSNDTYQPYAKTNKELTEQVSSLNTAIANKADSSKAYQTDDTTENSLADNDVIPFYDTSASAKRKIPLSKMFGQMVSNRNLLDNPFFTINQRGANSYDTTASGISAAYTLDRWWSIFANITVLDDGITLASPSGQSYSAYLRQAIVGEKALRGKKCTFSVDIAEITGTCTITVAKSTGMNAGQVAFSSRDITEVGIASVSFTVPNDAESNTYPYLLVSISAKEVGTASVKIRSAKFEEGEHSTLALDAEPNYAEELLKCQRYFVRLKPSTDPYSSLTDLGFCFTASSARAPIQTPVPMRATPSVSYSGGIGFCGITSAGETIIATGNITGIALYDDVSHMHFSLNIVTSTELTIGTLGYVRAMNDANAYIDISADL